MATTCSFGQIPDIRFTTLCCKGRVVIDADCNLFVASAFFDSNLVVRNTFTLPGTTINGTNGVYDFTGAKIVGFNVDIMGNIIGNVSGTVIDPKVYGNILGDIFGNIIGEIKGNIEGNILGNINAPLLIANTIIASELITNNANVDIVFANTLMGNMCINPDSAIVFKDDSEMTGVICIPDGATITFKQNSIIIIDTAFGTENDGDILVQSGNITINLPRGNNNQVLISNGNAVLWSSNIFLNTICGSDISTDQFQGNITSLVQNFDNLTANVILVQGNANIFTLEANKIFGDFCGNVLGNPVVVDGTVLLKNGLIVCGNLDASKGNASIVTEDLAINGNLLFQTANTVLYFDSNIFTVDGGNFTICNGNIKSDQYRSKTGTIGITAGNNIPVELFGYNYSAESILFSNGATLSADDGTGVPVGDNLRISGGNVLFSAPSTLIVNKDTFVDTIINKDSGNIIWDLTTNTVDTSDLVVYSGDLCLVDGNVNSNVVGNIKFIHDFFEIVLMPSGPDDVPLASTDDGNGSADENIFTGFSAWQSFQVSTVVSNPVRLIEIRVNIRRRGTNTTTIRLRDGVFGTVLDTKVIPNFGVLNITTHIPISYAGDVINLVPGNYYTLELDVFTTNRLEWEYNTTILIVSGPGLGSVGDTTVWQSFEFTENLSKLDRIIPDTTFSGFLGNVFANIGNFDFNLYSGIGTGGGLIATQTFPAITNAYMPGTAVDFPTLAFPPSSDRLLTSGNYTLEMIRSGGIGTGDWPEFEINANVSGPSSNNLANIYPMEIQRSTPPSSSGFGTTNDPLQSGNGRVYEIIVEGQELSNTMTTIISQSPCIVGNINCMVITDGNVVVEQDMFICGNNSGITANTIIDKNTGLPFASVAPHASHCMSGSFTNDTDVFPYESVIQNNVVGSGSFGNSAVLFTDDGSGVAPYWYLVSQTDIYIVWYQDDTGSVVSTPPIINNTDVQDINNLFGISGNIIANILIGDSDTMVLTKTKNAIDSFFGSDDLSPFLINVDGVNFIPRMYVRNKFVGYPFTNYFKDDGFNDLQRIFHVQTGDVITGITNDILKNLPLSTEATIETQTLGQFEATQPSFSIPFPGDSGGMSAAETLIQVVGTGASWSQGGVPPIAGKYFIVNTPTLEYYVWGNVTNVAPVELDPLLPGLIGVEVKLLSTDTVGTVADNIKNELLLTGSFYSYITSVPFFVYIQNKERGVVITTPHLIDTAPIPVGNQAPIAIVNTGTDLTFDGKTETTGMPISLDLILKFQSPDFTISPSTKNASGDVLVFNTPGFYRIQSTVESLSPAIQQSSEWETICRFVINGLTIPYIVPESRRSTSKGNYTATERHHRNSMVMMRQMNAFDTIEVEFYQNFPGNTLVTTIQPSSFLSVYRV